ncbi:MAG: GNAT family N-acetyltransferase [Clostridiales bacterium]|nr:GNAT family N-acetyltransferase [Clostridiales bacterium]
MRQLEDKKAGLVWLVPEIESIQHGGPVYIPEDTALLEDFRKELNESKSRNISKFVTGNCSGLGDFMLWAIMDKKYPCYAFEDGRLVATAIINPNNELVKLQEVRNYIRFCEDNPSVCADGIKGYISYKKAKQILARARKNNNSDIDYLVVVPKSQGKGIGTRAVSSISHNLDFFSPENPVSTLTTEIHKKNTASQKIFQRNGFEQYSLETEMAYNPFEEYIRTY